MIIKFRDELNKREKDKIKDALSEKIVEEGGNPECVQLKTLEIDRLGNIEAKFISKGQ